MIEVNVYGTDQACSGCINLPSSKETCSWLQAALGRRYGENIKVNYIDIRYPNGEVEHYFSQKIIDEDLWYPIIVINNEIVSEGNPKIREITKILDNIL